MPSLAAKIANNQLAKQPCSEKGFEKLFIGCGSMFCEMASILCSENTLGIRKKDLEKS